MESIASRAACSSTTTKPRHVRRFFPQHFETGSCTIPFGGKPSLIAAQDFAGHRAALDAGIADAGKGPHRVLDDLLAVHVGIAPILNIGRLHIGRVRE